MALVGIGVPCGMPRPAVSGLVYAPHLYDAFVDSGLGFDGEMSRLRRTLSLHRLTAARLGAPLVLGEWGHLDTLPAGPGRETYAQAAAAEIERSGRTGAAYWEARPGEERDGKLDPVLRPFPARVAGSLLSGANYEAASRTLSFAFRPEREDCPTVVMAPARLYPTGLRLAANVPVRWRYRADLGQVLILAPAGATVRVRLSPRGLGE